MVRSNRLLAAALAAFMLLVSTPHYATSQESEPETEPEVDCDALMTTLPDCTGMMYIVCTDGTDPTCADDTVSPQQAGVGNATSPGNGTTIIEDEPCEKFLCYDNGTYASMEDDAGEVVDVEDDSEETGSTNGTVPSTEDDTTGGGSSSSGGSPTGTSGGTSGGAASLRAASVAGSIVAISAGLSLVM